jgi:ATP-dependent exoDNAse (exonuclease V) alpha subunit
VSVDIALSRSASSANRALFRPYDSPRGGSRDVASKDKTDDPAIRMKSNLEPSSQEILAGLVERVTFHNSENGFCVLRAKARGHRDLVTVVGHAAIISAGEWITASGEWINDRAHGQQFKARFLKTSAPSSIDGIEKYLGSGMIRGIGPVYAKRMVKSFGEKVFEVIEAEPDRFREVTGIGVVPARRITDAWAEQKIVREIMVFLHSNGVGTARAVRIFKTYGADAVQVMTENPYRLARENKAARKARHDAQDGPLKCGANRFSSARAEGFENIHRGGPPLRAAARYWESVGAAYLRSCLILSAASTRALKLARRVNSSELTSGPATNAA